MKREALQILRQVYSRFLNEPIEGAAPRSHFLDTSDVFLASYPRSGNTWVRVLLANLLVGPGCMSALAELDELVPDIHRGIRRGVRRSEPRVIKTHQPFAFRHERHRPELYRRIIYIARHPVDVIRSYYAYPHRPVSGEREDLNSFARAVINGAVFPGSWNEHVLSWTHLEGRDMLLVRYEDLAENPGECARKLAAFLGQTADEQYLARVVAASDLKTMRALDKNRPLVPDHPGFIRPSGPGRQDTGELGPETLELVYSRSAEAMKELGYSPK